MLLDYPPAAHMMTVFGACQDEELLKNCPLYTDMWKAHIQAKDSAGMKGGAENV